MAGKVTWDDVPVELQREVVLWLTASRDWCTLLQCKLVARAWLPWANEALTLRPHMLVVHMGGSNQFVRVDCSSDHRVLVRPLEPTLPEPMFNTYITSYKGEVYVIGGFGGADFKTTPKTYKFKPGASVPLEPLAPLPEEREGGTVTEYNGKLFLFGGTNGVYWSNKMFVYDIAANKWEASTIPLPKSLAYFSSIRLKNLFYLIGGSTAKDSSDQTYIFDLETNQWHSKKGMRNPSSSPTVIECQGYIYAFSACERYSIEGDEWEPIPPLEDAYQSATARIMPDGRTIAVLSTGESIHYLDTATLTWPVERLTRTGTALFKGNSGTRATLLSI